MKWFGQLQLFSVAAVENRDGIGRDRGRGARRDEGGSIRAHGLFGDASVKIDRHPRRRVAAGDIVGRLSGGIAEISRIGRDQHKPPHPLFQPASRAAWYCGVDFNCASGFPVFSGRWRKSLSESAIARWITIMYATAAEPLCDGSASDRLEKSRGSARSLHVFGGARLSDR